MSVFEELQVWMDPVKRPGPEAMAVDEWLLETMKTPLLRIYGWLGDWGSVGYFGNLAVAQAAFPGNSWVRRWTGGGTVDHRADWTYTLVAPAGSGIAEMHGSERYRIVHEALLLALRAESIHASLSDGTDLTGAAVCFQNPVGHDLIDPARRKLAGAGQRRSRCGLLHQGSVAAPCDEKISEKRAGLLAAALAMRPRQVELEVPRDWIEQRIRSRYGSDSWTSRC
jgi:lipoate-protein ligase A